MGGALETGWSRRRVLQWLALRKERERDRNARGEVQGALQCPLVWMAKVVGVAMAARCRQGVQVAKVG